MRPKSLPLGHICEITASPSSDLFATLAVSTVGTPVVTPADITSTQRISTETLRRLPDAPAGLERYRLRPGDLVLVRLGSVGKVALLGEDAGDWVYHSSCIRIRPDAERVNPVYLAAYLAHQPVVDQLLSHVQVGTVPVLTADSLRSLPVVLPAPDVQQIMARALVEVGVQMDIQQQILTRLNCVRQGLLAHVLGDELSESAASRPQTSSPERRTPRTRRTNRMS
ncbi:restriction endonuclease subunit S [Streptomyces sp. NPDC051130]|uniref:restriction endonuclease subunit S n=1 Tax=Streptomyces sp. NPDC051130 TaxID=3157223 RepID=UPI0034355DA2